MSKKTAEMSNEAVCLIEMERYNDALECLHMALAQNRPPNRRRNFINSGLQGVHVSTGRTLDIARNPSMSHDNQQIRKGGQDDECDEGMRSFSFPLQIVLHALGEFDCNPIDQFIVDAIVNFNMGIAITRLVDRDLSEACSHFQKSLSLKQTYSSFTDHEDNLAFLETAILHNLGNIHYTNGQYDEALSKFRTAHQKLADALDDPSDCIDFALSLNCMGISIMYATQASDDGIEEALRYLSQALTIVRTIDKEDPPLIQRHFRQKIIATIMNNLGRVLVLRGNLCEALYLYKKALKIRRCIFGKYHIDTAAISFNMAEALHLDGQTDEALEMLHRFLFAASTYLGDDLVNITILFAEAYIESNDLPMAAQFYRKALRRLQGTYPPDEKEIAQTLNTLGTLLCKMGQYKSALKVSLDLESFISNIMSRI